MSTHTILYAYLYRHVDNIYSMSGDWIVYIINEYAFFFDHAARGMWDQRSNPGSLQWKHRVLITTGPPGKPPVCPHTIPLNKALRLILFLYTTVSFLPLLYKLPLKFKIVSSLP